MRSKSKEVSVSVADVNGSDGKSILKKIKDAREKRSDAVTREVSAILDDVRKRGDAALFDYTEKFDKVKVTASSVRVSIEHLKARAKMVAPELKAAIRAAAGRIRGFHCRQGIHGYRVKTLDGELAQIVKPLKRVGVYVPGGHTIYPSSVLMNIIPAQLAGVKGIVAVTPPGKGDIDPGVAYALDYMRVREVYTAGGAQAIGALAYGTKSIPAVDMIVGPGNAYVAAAKRLVYGTVGIDSAAGPSEVVIIADKSAPPRFVALDMLAQVEHGSGDEIAMCIVESRAVAEKIAAALAKEIEKSPVKNVLAKLPAHAITIMITPSRKESMELSNAIAPEHLQIMTETADKDVRLAYNASAIFLGVNTPVALGDYFIGTNHVLPTGGAARFASPLGVECFQKRISVAKASPGGLASAANYVPAFARAEAFEHHAMSVEARVEQQ